MVNVKLNDDLIHRASDTGILKYSTVSTTQYYTLNFH